MNVPTGDRPLVPVRSAGVSAEASHLGRELVDRFDSVTATTIGPAPEHDVTRARLNRNTTVTYRTQDKRHARSIHPDYSVGGS